jgi:hypothetical protein
MLDHVSSFFFTGVEHIHSGTDLHYWNSQGSKPLGWKDYLASEDRIPIYKVQPEFSSRSRENHRRYSELIFRF